MKEFLEHFKEGHFVMVYDHEREDEGDLFLLADFVTPEKINFLLKECRGMICVASDKALLDQLEINLITENNTNPHGTNFCVPVDLAQDITTGVSAFDRAKTIKAIVTPATQPDDFVRPGHTFPLQAQNPLQRFGHTEAAVELAKKVQALPTVVICEMLNDEGGKATRAQVDAFCAKHGILTSSLLDVKAYVLG